MLKVYFIMFGGALLIIAPTLACQDGSKDIFEVGKPKRLNFSNGKCSSDDTMTIYYYPKTPDKSKDIVTCRPGKSVQPRHPRFKGNCHNVTIENLQLSDSGTYCLEQNHNNCSCCQLEVINSTMNSTEAHSQPNSTMNSTEAHSQPNSTMNSTEAHSQPNSTMNSTEAHSQPNSTMNSTEAHSQPKTIRYDIILPVGVIFVVLLVCSICGLVYFLYVKCVKSPKRPMKEDDATEMKELNGDDPENIEEAPHTSFVLEAEITAYHTDAHCTR